MPKKTIVVTGGSGFIGSCMVRTLSDETNVRIVVTDKFHQGNKWQNLRGKNFDFVDRDDFIAWAQSHPIDGIVHMGAKSGTEERDVDAIMAHNFTYSKKMWDLAIKKGSFFIYASSAATYGLGQCGYDDCQEIDFLRKLPVLAPYGFSKNLFDLWALGQTSAPKRWQGLKFFNVYGPNETAKGRSASMVLHLYNQLQLGKPLALYRSYKEAVADGDQQRDFVYVKDVCAVMMHFYHETCANGLYNVGTGVAQSFNALASAVSKACEKPNHERCFIAMPTELQPQYQYFTEANIDKLRASGYKRPFVTLDEGVYDYICEHLIPGQSY